MDARTPEALAGRARPILFSAPMVRALLAGTKTQTRRILNPQPYRLPGQPGYWNASGCIGGRIVICDEDLARLHRYVVGDRLWVREAWRAPAMSDRVKPSDMPSGLHRHYEADGQEVVGFGAEACEAPIGMPGKLRPSMFMPRWASRLTLTVTEVRVERLQDISEDNAEAEGIDLDVWDMARVARDYSKPDAWFCSWGTHEGEPDYVPEEELHRASYRTLWDSINGPKAWDANPWVVAATFAVERRNIDSAARDLVLREVFRPSPVEEAGV